MKKIKLLLIDDDEKILKLVKSILNQDEFEVTTYFNADDIKNKILNIRPDLILLDIKLYGTSGIDAIKIIKADDEINKIPVIAFTSYTMRGDKEKFLNMGYDGYIPKPIDIHTFKDEILKYI